MTTIRALRSDERPEWERLFRAYGDFYKVAVEPQTLDAVWAWIFDADEMFWCDVAEVDGRLIGLTQYQLMHRSLGGSMVCYLSDLYVDPETRGGGVGRALIDHVRAFAADQGLPGVRWLTQEFNYDARKLYDRYGPKSDFILYTVPTDRD